MIVCEDDCDCHPLKFEPSYSRTSKTKRFVLDKGGNEGPEDPLAVTRPFLTSEESVRLDFGCGASSSPITVARFCTELASHVDIRTFDTCLGRKSEYSLAEIGKILKNKGRDIIQCVLNVKYFCTFITFPFYLGARDSEAFITGPERADGPTAGATDYGGGFCV